ncbi:uncharacterized protein LOC129592158 isoform X2 [Paramacrobiotus metropolitanus]|uniref:uncharacterized protein LOC129592158 isoform X2 n=1 Tax=Paramacrobiotus metropolitanus TaxID=2943436 RepID=UPI002446435E|nr:uncharacterized protein LOC129592158 isoform X2 [Paramacrobiotus metropolitanus]
MLGCFSVIFLNLALLGSVTLQDAITTLRIKDALGTIVNETRSCVKFKRRTDEKEYIWFELVPARSSCAAAVGRSSGRTTNIRLSTDCTKSSGTVILKILHALGFFYEHQRPDRDQYVQVLTDNILVNQRSRQYYAILPNMSSFGLPYDFQSITHAGPFDFSISMRKPAFVPRANVSMVMGQQSQLSPLDIARIRAAYACDTKPGKSRSAKCAPDFGDDNDVPFSTDSSDDNYTCFKARVMAMKCRSSAIDIPVFDPDKSDAAAAVFVSDATPRCVIMFHSFYYFLLELANATAPAASQSWESASPAVMFRCNDNSSSVLGPDLTVLNSNKIIIDTDGSFACRSAFFKFLQFVKTDFVENGEEAVDSLVPSIIPIDEWADRLSHCPEYERSLVVKCTTGIVTFSEPNGTTYKIIVASDNTFRCRQFVVSLHEHIVATPTYQVSHGLSVRNSIVAVCQQGRTVISDANPRDSEKINLVFYSAPNKLCQDHFRTFLNFIRDRATIKGNGSC